MITAADQAPGVVVEARDEEEEEEEKEEKEEKEAPLSKAQPYF